MMPQLYHCLVRVLAQEGTLPVCLSCLPSLFQPSSQSDRACFFLIQHNDFTLIASFSNLPTHVKRQGTELRGLIVWEVGPARKYAGNICSSWKLGFTSPFISFSLNEQSSDSEGVSQKVAACSYSICPALPRKEICILCSCRHDSIGSFIYLSQRNYGF